MLFLFHHTQAGGNFHASRGNPWRAQKQKRKILRFSGPGAKLNSQTLSAPGVVKKGEEINKKEMENICNFPEKFLILN